MPTNATASRGTLIQNTEDHPKLRISRPPTIGPSAIPAPLAAVQVAIAFARSRGSPNALTRMERVVGMINAPPTPMTPRPTMSVVVDPASALSERTDQEGEEAGAEGVAPPEPVAQAAGREQEPSEDDRVGRHDPLELRRAGLEFTDHLGQGDVDDRVVDGGDQEGEDQDTEDAPPVGVAR